MNPFDAVIRSSGLADALLNEDRRFSTRVKFRKAVRIMRPDCTEGEWETLVDLSRDGLYFTAAPGNYNNGMELRLLFPSSGSECACKVVRIECLPGGRVGVGATILRWH